MILKYLKNKKLIAGIILIALIIFVVYSSIPFLSAFFGAGILAYMFRPLEKYLRKKQFSKQFSATLIIIISLILVIIPTIFIVNGLIEQVSLLPSQIQKLKEVKQNIEEFLPFELNIDTKEIINQTIPVLTNSITPVFSNIVNAFIVLFLLFFILYYLIIYYDEIKKFIIQNLPFNEKNNKEIINKFKQVTNSTIIGTFFIAVIQGGLLALNFYLLGIPNALFWGFLALILSFIPIIGTPVIWIPASFFLLTTGEITKGIALIIIGILISTIDNIIRPLINERYGSIHPLISIIGIYIGISQFGIMGIFIGPLIVAYLIQFIRLYNEEYLR